MIKYYSCKTSIGIFTAGFSNDILIQLFLPGNISNSKLTVPHNNISLKLETELKNYINGDLKNFTVKYKLITNTSFSEKVLNSLKKKVPYGKTVSYKKLAELSNSNAIRCVGSIMKKNPLPIIFPCHRVIKSDGSIGNYGGGKKLIKLKKFLLDLEKNNFQ